MSDDDYDDFDWQGEYEARLVEDAIREQSEDQVSWYLGTYGDAVTDRLDACMQEGRALLAAGHAGPALTLFATAAELIVRFLVLRPLVQGAFLSDEWATILTKRVIGGRSAEDRDLLTAVARTWNLDLLSLTLADGTPMWNALTKELWPHRHAFVHAAELVDDTTSARALEAVEVLISDFLWPLAARFRMSWPATSWQDVDYRDPASGNAIRRSYDPDSPFR